VQAAVCAARFSCVGRRLPTDFSGNTYRRIEALPHLDSLLPVELKWVKEESVVFAVQHLSCGINFLILSVFHISQLRHTSHLSPHPMIPNLLSTCPTVSSILD